MSALISLTLMMMTASSAIAATSVVKNALIRYEHLSAEIRI